MSLPQKKTGLLAWCHFKICPATFTVSHQLCHCVTVCALPKTVCVRLSRVLQSHTERSVPTRLKKRCPEVGCPFPTSSPFQRLEIPLRTKRPDMIPQHCRRGREQGTVLIRRALLSGKILKGMQPIVVNCMGPHSIPSATGMCYWFWIVETSILTADQCLCFVFLWLILGFVDCTLFFFSNLLRHACNGIACSHCSLDSLFYCAHSHTAHFNVTCTLLCTQSHTSVCFHG